MNKPVRKAVRCFVMNDDKVLTIKYKKGNKKEDFFDIPGGKIEEGENGEQAAIREVKEETGIDIEKLKYKGNFFVEYPDRIFDLDIFVCNDYDGTPKEFDENTSEWICVKELLQKEKILSSIIILDRFYIKGLIDNKYNFKFKIKVDENENIFNLDYELIEIYID